MEGREAEVWGGRGEGELRREIRSLPQTGQTLAVCESAGRAREASSTLLAPSLPSCGCRKWVQCPSDFPRGPRQSAALQPVPPHPAELADFKPHRYNFCLCPAPIPPPCLAPSLCQPSWLSLGYGSAWFCWSAPAWRCMWALRCQHLRLGCVAVWVPYGRNIKPHGSVKPFPANRRAMQGLISALWSGCRACLSAQVLLQVTSGWAVNTP